MNRLSLKSYRPLVKFRIEKKFCLQKFFSNPLESLRTKSLILGAALL